jgi:hypothetical protein
VPARRPTTGQPIDERDIAAVAARAVYDDGQRMDSMSSEDAALRRLTRRKVVS